MNLSDMLRNGWRQELGTSELEEKDCVYLHMKEDRGLENQNGRMSNPITTLN